MLEYKQIEQKKTINSEGEALMDMLNKEAQEGWLVHTIDFNYGRALLVRQQQFSSESCCGENGVCNCGNNEA